MLKQVKDLPAVQVQRTWWVVLVRWSKALVKRVSIAEEGCVDCSTRNHRCLGVLGNSGGSFGWVHGQFMAVARLYHLVVGGTSMDLQGPLGLHGSSTSTMLISTR